MITFATFFRTLLRALPEARELFYQRSEFLYDYANKDVFNDLESDCSDDVDSSVARAQLEEEEKQRKEDMKLKCTAV